ncbi:mitochondrial ribonuclease P protein 3 [Arapaima gigas]
MSSLIFTFIKVYPKLVLPLLNTSHRRFLLHNNVLLERARLSNVRFESTKEGNRYPSHGNKAAKHKDTRLREKQPYFRSVFAAGTAQRTAELMSKKAGEEGRGKKVRTRTVGHAGIPNRPLTAAEWAVLKQNAPYPLCFEVQMMKRMLAAGSDINIAKSLLAYVAVETGTLSYELLLKYLTLCVHGSHHSEVLDVYEIMKNRFKSFDPGAYSLFIKGFSNTERWKEALGFLESLNKAITPTANNYGEVISAALRHGDSATGWALYTELLEKGLIPNQNTWQALFESGVSQRWHNNRLEGILHYMRNNQVYPVESLARSIKAWFESLSETKWTGSWSTVAQSGVCQSCGTALESIELSEKEYGLLKEQVMQDVMQGNDVFIKSTPKELENFQNFLANKPAFDVVLDGLNVAKCLGRGQPSEILLTVVSELKKQGLNVLVLGRSHMQRYSHTWDRQHMSLVRQMAHCFFTDNISEDDPFLLYATLHSGNHCRFVSKDLMRDHKACLPDSAMRRLFFKWQRGHQLVIQSIFPGKMVQFQPIHSYDTIVQTDGVSWHIPYDPEGQERCSYEIPTTWLCVKRVS